jgi:hypothetical protein
MTQNLCVRPIISNGFNSECLMLARNLIAVLIACLGLCASADAGAYEFTLTGEVTQANWANVNVGDPFTIRYTADSLDRNPAATVGAYLATPAVVTLPNATIRSLGPFNATAVYLFPDADQVRYTSEDDSLYTFLVRVRFPRGTLSSDALPLTLPMELAVSTDFYVWQFGPELRGTITSYTAVEVPEPGPGLVIGTLLLARLPHRRTHPLAASQRRKL